MTALCSFSQSDDLLSFESYNNNNDNNNNTTILQDYETVSQVDLFHFSEPEFFKDIERQRRAIQSQIVKKNKLKSKTGGDRSSEQQQQQRRKRQGNGNSSASESEQDEKSTQDAKEQQRQQRNNKSSSSSGSDSDRKKETTHLCNASKGNRKSIKSADRSNKRADRHRRPEDEILSSADNDSEDTESDSESEQQQRSHSNRTTAGYEEYEERIRFKHNLNFKTAEDERKSSNNNNNNTSKSAQKLTSSDWKQMYVQKLNEKDQHRAQQLELQKQKKHASRA